MAKSFSVSFNISGSLDGSLQAALRAAANSMRGLGNAARQASASAAASRTGLAGMANSLNQLQQAAQRYKQVQDALKQSTADFARAGQNLQTAKAKYEADAAAVEKLKQKLAELKAEQSKLGTAKSSGNTALKQLRQDLQKLKQAYADAKKAGDQIKMASLGAQIKSTQAAFTAQQATVKAAAQAYKELSEKVKKAKADLSAANAAAQASGRELSTARSSTQRLSQNFQSQLAALNQLKATLSAAGFNVSSFASAESRLAGDIDRVNAALQRQQALTNAQRQSAQASQEMFNAYNNFQGALNTAGSIAQPFKSAIDNAMTFEHSMSRVKALTQTSNIMAGDTATVQREMAKLESRARELGATTQFTMTQAADAMGYLGMAGWKAEKIYETMPGMLKLAAGAGTDLARTADIVSDNMTAMQIPVEQAQHFMDVYAYALTNSNVNLESLGETMKYAAPVAAAFGASLEDTAAMTMMMGNAGIKGSMAGTALRMGLLRLSGPPKKASKAMDELGISVSDATAMALEAEAELARYDINYDKNAPPMEKMSSIITQLATKMQGLSREEKLASIGAIFGANAASGWVNIIEQGPEVFNKYLNALKNCDGYSEQFAHTMNDDTRGAMIALESAVDAVINSVGTALLPAVRSAAEAFTPLATAAAQFIAAHPGIVQAAAAIAAALATIVVGAAAVKLAFAGWAFVSTSIELATGAVKAFQLGLAGTAIEATGLTAATNGLALRLVTLKSTLTGLTFANIGTALSTGATTAAAAFGGLGTAIATATRASLAFAFSPVGAALMVLAVVGLYCYQNWEKVSPVLNDIATTLSGIVSPAIDAAKEAVGTLFETLGQTFDSSAFQSLSEVVNSLTNAVGGGLCGVFIALGGIVASVLAGIVTGIAGLIKTVANLGTGIVESFYKLTEGDYSGAFDKLISTGSKAAQEFKSTWTDSLSAVQKGIAGTNDAINTFVHPEARMAHNANANSGGGLGAIQARATQIDAGNIPIDTSQTQAALDQVGSSAQNAASQMQGIQQATTGVDQMSAQFTAAGTGAQTFSTNAQQAGTNTQNLGTSAQNATIGTDSLGNSAQTATAGTDSLGVSAGGAVGNISAMAEAAGAVAGALSAKAVEISSIKISVPQISVAAAAPKANYKGGIYPKGQFLTTFAEKSPEAAIPIENSKRARELWTKTGQMLGMLPGSGGSYDSAEKDALGNVVGMKIPEYNRIGEGDTEDVKIDKRRVQREQFERERAKREIPRQPKIEQPKLPNIAPLQEKIERALKTLPTNGGNYESAEKDSLGNLLGIKIPEYNRIRKDDSEDVKIDKRRVQREQFERERAQREVVNQPKIEQPKIQKQAIEAARATDKIYSRQRATIARQFPTAEKKSGGLLPEMIQSIPGFKGNIGGFDILGGLTGGNIFGSFGALDFLGGGFPKQGKSPFPSTPISFGSILNGLGGLLSSGNKSEFGDLSGKVLNSTTPQVSTPPEFHVTIQVTVNGNADENTAQNVAQQTASAFNDWAENFFAFKHDEARRSFA